MKRLIAVVLPVLVLGGLITWRVQAKHQDVAAMARQGIARAQALPQVGVAVAETREITSVFKGTGTLEAPLNVKISPKISGRINYLQVQEGDRVRRGQVLVRLDASEIEAQVRQAEASVAEANYRLAQALIGQKPTTVGVQTQVKQQQAAVASASADYEQARQTLNFEIAAAQATVDDFQARIDTTQANINNANARINSVQANLANVRIRQSRILELYKQGYIAAQEVDDAKAAVSVQEAGLQTAQAELDGATAARQSAVAQKQAAQERVKITRSKGDADIEAAHQKLAQAQAQLEFAHANTAQSPAYKEGTAALKAAVAAQKAALASTRARRSDTVLSSPIEGYVSERAMDPGSMASPSQAILVIQSFREIWVNVPVPEQIAGRVQPGEVLNIALDALPGQAFRAAVIKVNPSADPQARQFTVRASMDNSQGLFKPGMYAHVEFVVERVTALTVPREAVEHDADGAFVYVVDGENKVHRRQATTGLADANFVSVTSGLKAGDRVVTECSVTLEEGQGVRVPGQGGEASSGARGGGVPEGGHPQGVAPGAGPQGGPPAGGGGQGLPEGRPPR